MADIIQIRRDTAANWTSANPTLAQGELGVETDTSKVKVGDGSTAWTSLSYLINTGGYAELGTAQTWTAVQKFLTTNETYGTVSSSAGSLTINTATGSVFSLTLTENVTSTTFSNPPTTGTAYGFTLQVTQDSTDRTITWPASVVWPSATAPTISSGSGAIDLFVFITHDGGTTWFGFVSGQAMG